MHISDEGVNLASVVFDFAGVFAFLRVFTTCSDVLSTPLALGAQFTLGTAVSQALLKEPI